MEILVKRICRCLWQILHFLFSLYEVCLWVRLRIIAFALWSYDLCQTQTKRQQKEHDFLIHCKRQLSKIPKHLNLIIGPEIHGEVNEELLSRLFTYALYMNIECVSFYDTRLLGQKAESNTRVIDLCKVKCPSGWKSKNLDDHRALWYSAKSELSNGVNRSNGCVPTPLSNGCSKATTTNGHIATTNGSTNESCSSLMIYQIQPKDNHSLIADVCRNLFRERHTSEIQQLLQQRPQLTKRIDTDLQHHLQAVSEPELSIVFSETLCTYGTLPWHTRFTEFQRYPRGKYFDAESFATILYKYSRCEQRWGK
ncbi:dehydrodolichyl diphosphate synthase complex subunit nus1 [Musca domestica]|uniref:ditrans,polycis-polyprenyl diphosphate synthase [(2E,6E)-farnesyldiphosphate specific] n=1 Tax=Musca domestica TaxID=7370 RepID=A0A9J7CZH4_MUSDO|nr:dehydrodolichyl diphosphate synthase complex subunit nus1 [Musca domestica]